jgi:hypothetical protein
METKKYYPVNEMVKMDDQFVQDSSQGHVKIKR